MIFHKLSLRNVTWVPALLPAELTVLMVVDGREGALADDVGILRHATNSAVLLEHAAPGACAALDGIDLALLIYLQRGELGWRPNERHAEGLGAAVQRLVHERARGSEHQLRQLGHRLARQRHPVNHRYHVAWLDYPRPAPILRNTIR